MLWSTYQVWLFAVICRLKDLQLLGQRIMGLSDSIALLCLAEPGSYICLGLTVVQE